MGWGCTSVNDPITHWGVYQGLKGDHERSKRVWPDEKLTHINFESMSNLKHPSLNKTRDFETRGVASIL